MSRDFPMPPSSSASSSYPSFDIAFSSSSSFSSRPFPSAGVSVGGAALHFNGAAAAAAALSAAQRTATHPTAAQYAQRPNPISWRTPNSASLTHSSILPALPTVPGASPPAAGGSTPQSAFINQHNESASRSRQIIGQPQPQPPNTFNPTQYVATPHPPPQVKFHRSRSSFIPNKWIRGPGDGTFGSIYLSYGGGEYGGKNFGGGPNLAFDRKRPDEIWEEEQAKKNAAMSATNKKKKPKTNKKKDKKPPAGSKEATARKLLTRARNQLLAHLSAPSCRLFSDADHVVAVSDDDLDDLLHAGGGDATKVITYLTEFDRVNRKFDSFPELMAAIQDARRAHGDFGAGTEEETNQQTNHTNSDKNEEEKTHSEPDSLAGHVTHRSDDYLQEPVASDGDSSLQSSPRVTAAGTGTGTGTGTNGSTNGGTGKRKKAREPTIAEKRAAKKAQEEEAKREAEQTKKNNVARAAAARAAKAADEKKSKDSGAAKATPKSTKKQSHPAPSSESSVDSTSVAPSAGKSDDTDGGAPPPTQSTPAENENENENENAAPIDATDSQLNEYTRDASGADGDATGSAAAANAAAAAEKANEADESYAEDFD